ncbi:MAG: His-Xaa-Ser system radical SAM maturase HxsB [Candidatus Omnitrophota bacterium]
MPTKDKIKDWAVLPYNSQKINGHYLISNFFGSWDLLTSDEFKRLERFCFDENDKFFNRLLDKGVIVTEESAPGKINEFRKFQSHLFTDASLHIAVLTTRCNLSCRYCQTKVEEPVDMDMDIAAQVLKYCFDMRNPNISLEFQGGEPLLNWEVLKFLVEYIHKFNTINKNINVSLVTNGVLLNDEKIDFLVDNKVNVCISLDGPAGVHDGSRVFKDGNGSYEHVKSAIKKLKEAYKKRNLDHLKINLLPTLNRESLLRGKEIIDEYVRWGAETIALRPINEMGGAGCQWGKIGYTPEEFNLFWAEAMDYILELNKKGTRIEERMATVMLKKILKKENPGYVDLMSPCGAGRSVITYMPNGDIYPCDEARMACSDMFKLGNVLKNSYEEIIKSPSLFSICQSSLMDLWSYNSAFLPWMGTCPVLNYVLQGNIVPKITQTPGYKIQRFQFEYLFRKMMEDSQSQKVFQEWAG